MAYIHEVIDVLVCVAVEGREMAYTHEVVDVLVCVVVEGRETPYTHEVVNVLVCSGSERSGNGLYSRSGRRVGL